MQTFLPNSDFRQSAADLDIKRLNKQKLECSQILTVLKHKREGTLPEGKTKLGWKNHPAVLMWVGHEDALKHYHNCIIDECVKRGINNTTEKHFLPKSLEYPRWITEDLIRSHQSNLIRKNKEHYGPKYPNVPDDLPYVWPTKLQEDK